MAGNLQPPPPAYSPPAADPSTLNWAPKSQVKFALRDRLTEVDERLETVERLRINLLVRQVQIARHVNILDELPADKVSPALEKSLLKSEENHNDVVRVLARKIIANQILTGATALRKAGNPPATARLHTITEDKISSPASVDTIRPSKPFDTTAVPFGLLPKKPEFDLKFSEEIMSDLVAEARRLKHQLEEQGKAVETLQSGKSKFEKHTNALESKIKSLEKSLKALKKA